MFRLLALTLLLCACLAACAPPVMAPTASSVPPFALTDAPAIAPTGAPTDAPTDLPTATPAPVGSDTETPSLAEGPIVRIRNLATGTYLFAQDGQAFLGESLPSDPASHWVVEAYQGAVRLQNVASGAYLSIEHLQPFVEVIAIEPVWMSPRWRIEGDPAAGAVTIRNLWHNWQVLFTKDDEVRYDRVSLTDENALWMIEPLSGTLATTLAATATPEVNAVPPTPANATGSRGAAVPWIEYEAEFGETNGEVLAPDRTFSTFAAESSGRSAVRLAETGAQVTIVMTAPANAIVVRYVIPDSEDGTGLDATLSLYVDGVFRQKLALTSRYAWSYGGEEYTFNVPKAGGAHHFYDETRALVGEIPVGATVTLQKDADDLADYYIVDLLDLEKVAPPLEMPQGYISIEECGAIPDDGIEDGDAIRACIAKARSAGTGVWIPPGVYESAEAEFEVAEVTIQGAGMWYSVLQGEMARFRCVGNDCRFSDFAILGETILRDDESPENGFNGSAGTGSRLDRIWVEHTKVGYWVSGGTDGLVIADSRFRNLFADGVNFCNGTSHSVIENSHFRNTGDDAMASWSPQSDPPNTGNVFRYNTVQLPWRANCLAIYGGTDNRIEDNLCYDTVTYPGILIAQQFNSNLFAGETVVARNSIVRGGGPMFRQEHGALKVWADQGTIDGLTVRELLIDEATFSGIELEGSYAITNTLLAEITVERPAGYGIVLRSNLSGNVTFSGVTVSDPGKEALLNYAPSQGFQLDLGEGNAGW